VTSGPRDGRAAALLAATVTLWGTQFVAIDVAAAHAPPVVITALRATLGAAALLLLLPLVRSRLPTTRRLWLWAGITGLLMVVLILGGISEGTARAGAGNAAVLANTAPFFVLVLGRILLGERMSALGVGGLALGFAGVVVMVSSQLGRTGDPFDFALGAGLALAGAAGWGAGTLIVKWLAQEERFDIVGFTAAQYIVGAPILGLLVLLSSTGAETAWSSRELWLPVLYIGIASSALASAAFFFALRRTPASRAAAWQFLVPVVAIVIEVGRGNRPTPLVLAGMALAVVGVALSNLAPVRTTTARTVRGQAP
jgi:drug/metabolite transporter (DMT)-like permease